MRPFALFHQFLNTLSLNSISWEVHRRRWIRAPKPRGFIKFLCRRSVGFFSRAFSVFLMKESKKRWWKQPSKLMAKSCSQPVNLPGAWPLMNPLIKPLTLAKRFKFLSSYDNFIGENYGPAGSKIGLGHKTRLFREQEFQPLCTCMERIDYDNFLKSTVSKMCKGQICVKKSIDKK